MAGACFIGLAIYSWGLPVKTALSFLIICLGFLVAIVALAAIIALAIRILRRSIDD